MISSGGLVIVGSADGNLYAFESGTGKVMLKKVVGGGLFTQPTIGADAKGRMLVFLQSGYSYGGVGQHAPGALMTFGLPDKLPEPQVITKEVIKEVPKEVIKEVVKEVPKEVIKEVVKEVPKEVVKEVTKTVTVETISPVSYAAIGIGVVLVVIAGVLFTRRKKV